MSNCCVKGFDDEYIIEFIKDLDNRGNCSYCRSRNTFIADTSDVGEFIREGLHNAYENIQDSGFYLDYFEEGSTIFDVLNFSECIFSEKISYRNKHEELCNDLLDDSGLSVRDINHGAVDLFEGGDALIVLKDELFAADENEFQFSWDIFKFRIMHNYRFHRYEQLEILNVLFEPNITYLDSGFELWRARITSRKDFCISINKIKDYIGPAPQNRAGNNRMSPPGISYTYLGSDLNTCIAEIRPSVGEYIMGGKFITRKKLKILDLCSLNHIRRNSIFSPNYDHDLRWADQFMKHFVEEISKPVNFINSPLEYIPTQAFSEHVRTLGYDGIKYKSSQVEDGINYILFYGPRTKYNNYFREELPFKEVQIPPFTKSLTLKRIEYRLIEKVEYMFDSIFKEKDC